MISYYAEKYQTKDNSVDTVRVFASYVASLWIEAQVLARLFAAIAGLARDDL